MIYLTGDTHGEFEHVEEFCLFTESADDVLIILGDAGINYYGYPHDHELKRSSASFQ